MTDDEARRLAEFIKDHDKRFEAKAATDGGGGLVKLTLAADGTELEPITEIAQYRAAHIERSDPGPTVRAAWQKWQAQSA